jgi:hypothetical protein
MRANLDTLFRVGALVEVKAGGGRRVVVQDEQTLRRWIEASYPSGLEGISGGLPPRAESVANFADSKRGRPIDLRLVFMRGFGSLVLRRAAGTLPLAELTREYDVAGVAVDPEDPWQLEGSLALVEGLEIFMHIERVKDVDAALWYVGRLDQRLLPWLAEMPKATVLHMPDYDPVGLSTYLRIREALRDRVTLFVPEDLDALVARFGKTALLVDSAAELGGVRLRADNAARAVLDVLDRHGKGLEQESLLIPANAR